MKKNKIASPWPSVSGRVISLPVRWHFRFQLSLRDIEELLFEFLANQATFQHRRLRARNFCR